MNKKHMTLAEAEAMARRDRNRLVIMTLAVAVLGVGYLVTRFYGDRFEEQAREEQARQMPDLQAERIVTIDFDKTEVLEGIRDERPEDRVLEDSEPLADVLDYARLQTRRHYEALGIRGLTPDVYDELAADPGAYRVKPFRVRGEIVDLSKRRRAPARPEETHGTLQLEDGRYAHFVVIEMPQNAGLGDFVRVDGCFLKLFSREGADGWMEGPLLLSQKAEPSVRSIAAVENLDELLATVEDDRFLEDGGIYTPTLPGDAKWGLMSYAASHPDVDWDAAPELDTETLTRIFNDGAPYRGKPFRLPISRNQGSWVEAAGENPLRLDKITTGWIGNMVWKGAAPVIQFIGPFERPELQDRAEAAKLVLGRGFFLKNVFYQRSDGRPGRVPLFVMETVDVFTPVTDERPVWLMWGVLGATLLLAGCFWVLLIRDKRSSKALQAELTRRRRARRDRHDDESLLAES